MGLVLECVYIHILSVKGHNPFILNMLKLTGKAGVYLWLERGDTTEPLFDHCNGSDTTVVLHLNISDIPFHHCISSD